jgi:hypothetical protein
VTFKLFKVADENLLLSLAVSFSICVMSGAQLLGGYITVLEVGSQENVDADHQSMSMVLL